MSETGEPNSFASVRSLVVRRRRSAKRRDPGEAARRLDAVRRWLAPGASRSLRGLGRDRETRLRSMRSRCKTQTRTSSPRARHTGRGEKVVGVICPARRALR